jgi:hypothetical protein
MVRLERTHFEELGIVRSARESAGKLFHTSPTSSSVPKCTSATIRDPLSRTSPSGNNDLDKASP